MHRVEYVDRDRWRIVDRGDHTVFLGSKQQAEDWLDFQENVRRQPTPSPAAAGSIVRTFLAWCGNLFRGTASLLGHSRLRHPVIHRPARKH